MRRNVEGRILRREFFFPDAFWTTMWKVWDWRCVVVEGGIRRCERCEHCCIDCFHMHTCTKRVFFELIWSGLFFNSKKSNKNIWDVFSFTSLLRQQRYPRHRLKRQLDGMHSVYCLNELYHESVRVMLPSLAICPTPIDKS